jgi:hypothetical protein
LYKKFAANHSGVTLVAATNVGPSQNVMQQVHLRCDEKDGSGDATVGMIGAADVKSPTSTDSACCAFVDEVLLFAPVSSGRPSPPVSGTDANDAERERSLVTVEYECV